MIEFNRSAIGKVILKLRTDRKQSQEVVSGFAGIARSHLSMIETGAKQPNLETLWAIANAFEIHPYELVKLIEEEIQKTQNEQK